MAISLTSRQQLVLRHMVIDAEGWIEHAETKFGTEIATIMLEQKVTKYEVDYDAKVAAGSYKDRLQQEIDNEHIAANEAALQAIMDAR
tara:strand:+ start:345 stop:608 length:264 start_codon:yes stop_codon:yes gene_type:complete